MYSADVSSNTAGLYNCLRKMLFQIISNLRRIQFTNIFPQENVYQRQEVRLLLTLLQLVLLRML